MENRVIDKEWEKFAQYCLDRDKGLRKQAFGYLQNHISKLSDIKLQKLLTKELENYAELVRNYVEWKK